MLERSRCHRLIRKVLIESRRLLNKQTPFCCSSGAPKGGSTKDDVSPPKFIETEFLDGPSRAAEREITGLTGKKSRRNVFIVTEREGASRTA